MPEDAYTRAGVNLDAADAAKLRMRALARATHGPEVLAGLDFLAEHLPPTLSLVVAARRDPELPLARLRARGELDEIRADELRFTYAEAEHLLNQTLGLALPPEEVQALILKQRALALGAVPAEPPYQFQGRSRELLKAERLLARERYIVVLGEGGEGKTTLAANLASPFRQSAPASVAPIRSGHVRMTI